MTYKDCLPCEICGFDLYTEEHHISGKVHMTVVYMDGEEAMILKRDPLIEWGLMHSIKRKQISVKDEKRYLDEETIILCANCHDLHHKRKMTYQEIYNKYYSEGILQKMDKKLKERFSDKLRILDMKAEENKQSI